MYRILIIQILFCSLNFGQNNPNHNFIENELYRKAIITSSLPNINDLDITNLDSANYSSSIILLPEFDDSLYIFINNTSESIWIVFRGLDSELNNARLKVNSREEYYREYQYVFVKDYYLDEISINIPIDQNHIYYKYDIHKPIKLKYGFLFEYLFLNSATPYAEELFHNRSGRSISLSLNIFIQENLSLEFRPTLQKFFGIYTVGLGFFIVYSPTEFLYIGSGFSSYYIWGHAHNGGNYDSGVYSGVEIYAGINVFEAISLQGGYYYGLTNPGGRSGEVFFSEDSGVSYTKIGVAIKF